MTPRQETDEHDDTDSGLKPSPSPLPPPTLSLPTQPTSGSPPKLRRPLSTNAAEFFPSTPLTPTSPDTMPATPTSTTSSFLIRPSLELATPKRSPTVDSLLSALTPDEPREAKEEDTDELWAKLRCGSLRTEEVAEREKQKQERQAKRQNRCADYPGLAFGSAMFGSDTTMRFNIIKNELHNIMRSQLKRVDGEVNALSSRVKKLDMNLEESERLIRTATSALSECVSLQIEDSKSRSQETESQSNLSAFDQHILYLETQLKDAKIKASHSLQIMEDCDKAQETLLLEPSPLQPSPQLPSLISPTDNKPQSSRPPTFDPSTILNNNLEEAIHNINNNNINNNNSSSSSTSNNMVENNNNNNTISVTPSTEVMSEGVSGNANCLQSLMTEEDDRANGNVVPLPV